MVGWHHRLNGHEFEKTLGVGDRWGSLVCRHPWGLRVGQDLATENTNKFGEGAEISRNWSPPTFMVDFGIVMGPIGVSFSYCITRKYNSSLYFKLELKSSTFSGLTELGF